MRWWLRNVATGAGVGFVVGLVVGGTLGRVFMRLLVLARDDTRGFETAMGATIGDFTSRGTLSVYGFASFAGTLLGLGYAVCRPLLPPRMRSRTAVFVFGTTAFMLGQTVFTNREDFAILPVTLSLALAGASVALTAAPVPVLIEKLAPDRERRPGALAPGLVFLGLAGFAAFGLSGIAVAYSQ